MTNGRLQSELVNKCKQWGLFSKDENHTIFHSKRLVKRLLLHGGDCSSPGMFLCVRQGLLLTPGTSSW